MKESIDKIYKIAETTITAVSEGLNKPTVDSPASEVYNRLKAHIEATYGNDSDLFQAVLNLEQKPQSKGRQGTVREEFEESVGVENDTELFKLALNLKEYLEPIQPKNSRRTPFGKLM